MYLSAHRQRITVSEPNLEAFVEDIDPTDIVHLETSHKIAHRKRKEEKSHVPKDPVTSEKAVQDSNIANAEVHVVPSGQVYKQLFDAGAQLRRAYDTVHSLHEDVAQGDADRLFLPVAISSPQGGIPVVRIKRNLLTEGSGILSVRQQNWLATLPFEATVENPTVLKSLKDSQAFSDLEEGEESPSREVQNLPDIVEHHKKGSNVISRISKSRRERHDRACDEMHQSLVLIAAEFEPKLEAIGSDLIARLSENDRQLEVALARLDPEAGLYEYAFEEMQQLWQDVEVTARFRNGWIEEANAKLQQIEDARTLHITAVIRQQSSILEKISHLSKLDLEKYTDELSQLMNQIILSNRRAYANLQLRVSTANIEQEKRMHDFFVMRLNEWKQFQVTRWVDIFRTFMMNDRILTPPEVRRQISIMTQELKEMNEKRIELLDALVGFKPPSSTKRYIYQWNEKMAVATAKLGDLVNTRMESIFSAYEAASQECAQKATDIRRSLLEAHIMSEPEADELVNTHLIPMIGERQKAYEDQMELMNEEIDGQTDQINKELKLLFTFCQGAAHLWDVHEVGLAQTERALQERLHIARRDHDAENQDRENHLDITMDRMRQDAGEQNLQKNLRRVKEQLEQIREMYKKFHLDQLELVQSYPYMVKDGISDYDKAVKRYFSVDTAPPLGQGSDNHDEISTSTQPTQQQDENQVSLSITPSQGPTGKLERSRERTGDMVVPPLLGSIGDMVTSDKGTCFYVVAPTTVADRVLSNAAPQSSRPGPVSKDAAADAGQTFLTQTQLNLVAFGDKNYLSSFFIPSTHFDNLKKCIRLNFINHLESWCDSAMQRAHSVVAAKCEELHSELELRLHLHAPRVKRAEVDVHNVRAAELVLHNERVLRHCKGITQSLAELRNRFEGLTNDHQKLFEKFQREADGMDSVIIEATKSAKLAEMQTRLQRGKDTFLEGVRQSLRSFRQTLDSELQMLRESNANFIKSFRLFSDGGNFCPEEIDGFRKRLDKCSHKIDDSEGIIMSELEGVESKWLHKAAHLYNDSEDRFRHHMTDLVFMEKVARWLMNTQVKIKVEVAESNGQAQKLAQLLAELERRLSACEEPHPDKEVVVASDLYTSLKPLFAAFHTRCAYLDCALKEPAAGSAATDELKEAKTVTRGVGFMDPSGVAGLSAIQPPTKAGAKAASEDPTIAAIKNIYRMQKAPTVPAAAATSTAGAGSAAAAAAAAADPAPVDASEAVQAVKPGGDDAASAAARASTEKQHQHAVTGDQSQPHHLRQRGSKASKVHGVSTTASPTEPAAVATNNRHSSAVRRVNKFDRREKRFQLFPDESAAEESSVEATGATFLGKIKHTLHEAQDGLFEAAELYYRQKGARTVTRPQALQETMEQCAEIITEKLRSYYRQCDEYHNECLQELRLQLVNVERHAARVPPLVLSDLSKVALAAVKRKSDEVQQRFAEQESKLEHRKSEHKTLLRPTLGHPNLAEKMTALCQNEDMRTKETLNAIEQLEKGLKDVAERHAAEFITNLADKAAAIMLDFDTLLTVDDTVKGKLMPKKYPTTELLRRNQCGLPLDDVVPETMMQRGSRTWDGLVKNELVAYGKPSKKTSTPTVSTAKTTMGHHACQQAKIRLYAEYKQHFDSMLDSIGKRKTEQVKSEERWYGSWQVAVTKIKMLYRD